MAPSRKHNNGRSPLVNPQRQITSFFSKTTGTASPSPSPSPTLSQKQTPKSNPKPKPNPPSPDPSPTTPSPIQSKPHKPLLVIGQTPSPSSMPGSSVARSYGKEVVDRRIRVYWPLDKTWYEGCVKSYDVGAGKHLVQYDDFEEELLDLGKEKIEWVEETVMKFKRLRRGSLAFKQTVVEDEEMENVVDVEEESNGVGDDSSDEDWEKNMETEVSEEEKVDVDLEDEVEDDNGGNEKKGKAGGKSQSRKRKASSGGKLASCKSKGNGDVGKEGFKISVVEPVKNEKSK